MAEQHHIFPAADDHHFAQQASFKQVGLVTVIRYEGEFRVCYRPEVEIVSWGSLHGDATYTVVPWE